MKRFMTILVAAAMMAAAHAQQFEVTAQIDGLPNGTILTLVPMSHAKLPPAAEAEVKNGVCTFSGAITINEPLCVRMQVKDAFGNKTLVIDKDDDLHISCKVKPGGESKGTPIYEFTDFHVENSPLTDKYYALRDHMQKPNEAHGQLREYMYQRMPNLKGEIEKARAQGRESIDSLRRNNADMQLFQRLDSINFNILQNTTVIELYKLGETFWGPLMMLDTWWYFTPRERPVYETFSQAAKDSWYGRMVREELYPGGATGEKIKPFTVTNDDGTEHTLASLSQGKRYVLIDFWASWCGPCRKEIPNVKRQYDLYKDRGFQVVSISIDKDENAWRKALADEQLPWPNFLDRSGIADSYKVKAIPAMYLVSADGTIIATDTEARGQALADKLATLFK